MCNALKKEYTRFYSFWGSSNPVPPERLRSRVFPASSNPLASSPNDKCQNGGNHRVTSKYLPLLVTSYGNTLFKDTTILSFNHRSVKNFYVLLCSETFMMSFCQTFCNSICWTLKTCCNWFRLHRSVGTAVTELNSNWKMTRHQLLPF